MKTNKKYILISLTFILLSISCSTEKNTFVSRSYHNLTAHYNVYFNGREAYNKGTKRLEDQHVDDFTRLLPIYINGNEESASSVAGDMDKAIKKASKTIKYHSIKVKPKQKSGNLSKKQQKFMKKTEYNRWVDDSYLLMGKAYFMKAEFLAARQNFEYIIREYRDEDIKYDAMYWMARTSLATGNMKMCRQWLDQISAEKEFPDELIADVEVLNAAYYLELDEKDAAIPHLTKSIKENKNKKERVRHQYLLAQLYKEKENFRKAAQMFEKVYKTNAPYEMEFNAKINMAECYGKLGGSYKDMKKLLRKMLKDDKNIDYLDQVYYALAEIEFKNDRIEDAITNYRLSSEYSLTNNNQKAISCMKLGYIYFERPDYRLSQAFFDTCIMNLSNEHPKYDEIRMLSKNLTGLVEKMDVVETEDSLQRIAALPEKERNAMIDKIIADVIEQERLEQELERERQQNSMLFDERRGSSQVNAPTGGKWYFYNPATLSFGQNEFRKKWGNRKLEDHWRRSNKAIIAEPMFADGDTAAGVDSTAMPRISDNKSREYYLQDLPMNDSLLALSHERIRDALFALGEIYKRDFSDWDKSILAYEQLDEKYPEHGYKLPTYYSLYELYTTKENASQAGVYKQKVISMFPDSHYAKLLINPNYLKELSDKLTAERIAYEALYELYRTNKINQAQQEANIFLRENPDSEYAPKVKFIQIISSALDVDEIVFKQNLAGFIQDYPEDPLSNRAMRILGYLGESDLDALIADLNSRPDVALVTEGSDSINTVVETPLDEIFSFDTEEEHYYIIATLDADANIKKLTFEVTSFNIFTFSMRTFTVTNPIFTETTNFVLVKKFKNKKQSVNYMKLIQNNRTVFSVIDGVEHVQFVISVSNFEILKKEKDLDMYLEYYQQKY